MNNLKNSTLVLILVLVWNVNFGQSKQPNIIFIMSDDHTSQAIGAYGGRLVN